MKDIKITLLSFIAALLLISCENMDDIGRLEMPVIKTDEVMITCGSLYDLFYLFEGTLTFSSEEENSYFYKNYGDAVSDNLYMCSSLSPYDDDLYDLTGMAYFLISESSDMRSSYIIPAYIPIADPSQLEYNPALSKFKVYLQEGVDTDYLKPSTTYYVVSCFNDCTGYEIRGNVVSFTTVPDNRDEEIREEISKLMVLYAQTKGDTWTNNTNWRSDKPLNEWYGIQTNELGYVTSIDLSNNNLTGCAHLDLVDFPYMDSININNNKIENLSIRGNNNIREIILNNCATTYIDVQNFDNVEISCEALKLLSGYCDTLKVSNCDFGIYHTPFSGIEVKEATIYNCKMHSCGISSEILTFESSSTYDTWHCFTGKRLNIIDSYCSTICGGDFYDNTVIHLYNATLWRSNWDEESRVTLSCTTTGAGWYSLFE